MSNMLKCPNPSCPYVFDPSQVPVGVVLSCPRCAMQFTLGPPAPIAPPSTTAAIPPNQPPAPFPPTEADFSAPGRAPAPPRQSQADRAQRSREREAQGPPGRGGSKAQVFILAGIVAVLLAGAALAIIFKVMRRGETVTPDTVSRDKDLNIGIDTPPAGWTRDDTMRVKLGSPYVMSYRRENPEAYMAFGANTFGNTDPNKGRGLRFSEMKLDQMQAFPKLFDISTLRPDPPPESKWLGESIVPDLGFKFRARSPGDGLDWAGESYVVSHKGIAYYWLSWSQEGDYEGLKDQFAAFRGKFKILELRKDWKETQSAVIDYKGDKVPYTISDAEEVWKEVNIAEEKKSDPDLDRLLRINQTPRRDRKAIPDEAELRVYILPAAGDPTQVARKFAEDRETTRIAEANATFAPPAFEELTGPPQGDPIVADVHSSTPVVRLHSTVKESKDAARLIVVSGLKVGENIVVVHCWCEYRKRSVFETRFVQIASSLR